MIGGGGYYRTFLLCNCVCLLLSGCSHRPIKNECHENEQEQKTVPLEQAIEHEALFINIPLPLYDQRIAVPILENQLNTTYIFGYTSSLSQAQIAEFFMVEMERYGWEHLVSFNGKETIIEFASPSEYCTVIVYPFELCQSTFYIYIKRASSGSSPIGSELG